MPLTIVVISADASLAEVVQPLLQAGDRLMVMPEEDFSFQALREAPPELIIIDLDDPPLRKLDLLARIERHPSTRRAAIVAVSDFPELEFEVVRVLDFLAKPVVSARIETAVATVRSGGGDSVAPVELSTEEHRLFHDFLLLNTGLHFEKRNLRLLERGIRNRMSALRLTSCRSYYDYLLAFHTTRNELKKLLQYLTIGETFFFRYHGHYDALAHLVLPHLRQEKGADRRLRIWSAGCSTGEEAYSIAITLLDHMSDIRSWDVRIMATDINHASLATAREALYGDRTMRLTPADCLDRHFVRRGARYAVDDKVKQLVDFSWLNLQADFPWEGDGLFDVIFCRNVMIYFSPATLRALVRKLAAALRPGGYLFLGHAESLYQISDDFEPISRSGSFFYRKRQEPRQAQARRPEHADEPKRVIDIRPPRPLPPPEDFEPTPAVTAVPAEAEEPPNIDQLLAEAWARFDAEDFGEAEARCREVLDLEPGRTDARVLFGFILANEGRLDEGLRQCNAALADNDLLPGGYYLRGLINDLADKAADAGTDYRRAILLQNDLVMAHYCLARLLVRQGKHREALRSLRSAARELEKAEPLSQVPFSGGLAREEMIELIRKEVGAEGRRVNDR